MMTPKTDLTENLDFSGGILRTYMRYDSIDDLGIMLNYRISRLELFFGRKYHSTEKSLIFNDNERYMYETKTHCLRCGIELRLPWCNNDGLCDKCSIELDRDLHMYPWGLDKDKDPWIEGTYVNGIEDKQTRNELFSLR